MLSGGELVAYERIMSMGHARVFRLWRSYELEQESKALHALMDYRVDEHMRKNPKAWE